MDAAPHEPQHRLGTLLGRGGRRQGKALARAMARSGVGFAAGLAASVGFCLLIGMLPIAIIVTTITVSLVLGSNVGRLVRDGIDRMIGVSLGGLIGVLVYFAYPEGATQHGPGAWATFSAGPAALSAGVAAGLAAVVTVGLRLRAAVRLAVALAVFNALFPGPDAWIAYRDRVIATAVALVVAGSLTLAQSSLRARKQLRLHLAVVVDHAAEVLRRVVSAELSGEVVDRAEDNERLRLLLDETNAQLAELRTEPALGDGWHRAAQQATTEVSRLVVAVRAMLRSNRDPRRPPLPPVLADPLRELGEVLDGCLQALAGALRAPRLAPVQFPADPMAAVRTAEAALDAPRHDGLLASEPTHAVLRAFALLYDAEVVADQVTRLADLLDEVTRGRPAPTGG